MNLKPRLQLDVTEPTVAKRAKMPFCLLRPRHGYVDDPVNIGDQAAIQQLE